jgi:medium-chain acyl-[acyl-carrier-protein] hydrolase
MAAFIQTDTYTVKGYETDANGQLSAPSLMNWMQESANRNALDYGIGITDLARVGLGWILTRLRLRIHQAPSYGETVRLMTYPTMMEKYFIYRAFRLLADDNTLLAEADSTWLVFDIDRRTMVTLPPFIRSLELPTELVSAERLPMKPAFLLPSAAPETQTRERTVEWFDIDHNQHTNNVSYVKWLVESVPDNILKTSRLAELDLYFRAESRWQDTLRLLTASATDASLVHRIEHAADGREVLLARSWWRE